MDTVAVFYYTKARFAFTTSLTIRTTVFYDEMCNKRIDMDRSPHFIRPNFTPYPSKFHSIHPYKFHSIRPKFTRSIQIVFQPSQFHSSRPSFMPSIQISLHPPELHSCRLYFCFIVFVLKKPGWPIHRILPHIPRKIHSLPVEHAKTLPRTPPQYNNQRYSLQIFFRSVLIALSGGSHHFRSDSLITNLPGALMTPVAGCVCTLAYSARYHIFMVFIDSMGDINQLWHSGGWYTQTAGLTADIFDIFNIIYPICYETLCIRECLLIRPERRGCRGVVRHPLKQQV